MSQDIWNANQVFFQQQYDSPLCYPSSQGISGATVTWCVCMQTNTGTLSTATVSGNSSTGTLTQALFPTMVGPTESACAYSSFNQLPKGLYIPSTITAPVFSTNSTSSATSIQTTTPTSSAAPIQATPILFCQDYTTYYSSTSCKFHAVSASTVNDTANAFRNQYPNNPMTSTAGNITQVYGSNPFYLMNVGWIAGCTGPSQVVQNPVASNQSIQALDLLKSAYYECG